MTMMIKKIKLSTDSSDNKISVYITLHPPYAAARGKSLSIMLFSHHLFLAIRCKHDIIDKDGST